MPSPRPRNPIDSFVVALMPTRAGFSPKAAPTRFGSGFLRDIWYFAALGRDVKPGSMARHELLGEPVLIGRDRKGELFALRDVCPHRAAPLSAGKITTEPDGQASVECPYHGWRFGRGGACTAVPSLTGGQEIDISRIRVRRYPVAESQGMIFVWMAADPRFEGEPPEPPAAGVPPLDAGSLEPPPESPQPAIPNAIAATRTPARVVVFIGPSSGSLR